MIACISENAAATTQGNESCGSCELWLLSNEHGRGTLVCTEIGSGRITCHV